MPTSNAIKLNAKLRQKSSDQDEYFYRATEAKCHLFRIDLTEVVPRPKRKKPMENQLKKPRWRTCIQYLNATIHKNPRNPLRAYKLLRASTIPMKPSYASDNAIAAIKRKEWSTQNPIILKVTAVNGKGRASTAKVIYNMIAGLSNGTRKKGYR